jgi:hypothetical protein
MDRNNNLGVDMISIFNDEKKVIELERIADWLHSATSTMKFNKSMSQFVIWTNLLKLMFTNEVDKENTNG